MINPDKMIDLKIKIHKGLLSKKEFKEDLFIALGIQDHSNCEKFFDLVWDHDFFKVIDSSLNLLKEIEREKS